MNIVVKLLQPDFSDIELPKYETEKSAGMDVRANVKEDVTIAPLQRKLIPTGLRVAIPVGYEIQVRSRSGLALKNGIFVLNSPGTIDADYRGDIGVILANLSDTPFVVKRGDRIGQIVLQKVERAEFDVVAQLDETRRGDGGFGHTGVK